MDGGEMIGHTQAITLRRDDGRYYRGVSPGGRIQTTPILAEAKLFGYSQASGIWDAQMEFFKRGSRSERVIVRVDSR